MDTLQPNCLRMIQNHQMLDAIRLFKRGDATVETFREYLGISRSTADKLITSLREGDESGGEIPLYTRQGRQILPVHNAAFFLGISVGSSHIRVSVLGLDFEPCSRAWLSKLPHLSELETLEEFEPDESSPSSYSYRTPADTDVFDRTRTLISGIVSCFIAQADLSHKKKKIEPFPLMGIGLAVTGPVDYDEQLWCSANRFTDVQGITLVDLIGYENFLAAEKMGIFLSLDNNAKAAMVSEYQFLKEQTQGRIQDDVALLYIGTGLGAAAVIDQTLMRNSNNMCGEVGFLSIDVQGKTRSMESYLRPHENPQQALMWIIPRVLTAINCILGVERIILIGHSLRANTQLIPNLLARRIDYTVISTQRYCKPELGRGAPDTAAIGAAIEAYFSMCKYDMAKPSQWINLAHTISWK